jgi:hypothetical protein
LYSSINKRIKKQAAEDQMTITATKDQESIQETAHLVNRTANSKHLEQSKPQITAQKTITTRLVRKIKYSLPLYLRTLERTL